MSNYLHNNTNTIYFWSLRTLKKTPTFGLPTERDKEYLVGILSLAMVCLA